MAVGLWFGCLGKSDTEFLKRNLPKNFLRAYWQQITQRISTLTNASRPFVTFLPAALAEAGLELTLSLSHSVSKTQMSHLEAHNAKSAQSKDV